MSEIHVIVASPEEAYDYAAEFWCGKPTSWPRWAWPG